MKKAALGFIALAMSLMSTTAQAAYGDIRAIDPCDEYGYVIDNGSIAHPYTAGQTAYFRIRLENLNSVESWNARNEAEPANRLSNPWFFEYLGPTVDMGVQWMLNPPKVGVYVSGQLRPATITYPAAPADKGWYTDIICSYTVLPGDLAFPMTLANSEGKEIGNGISNAYYLDTFPTKTSAWRLKAYKYDGVEDKKWGPIVATNVCTFSYANYVDASEVPGSLAQKYAAKSEWETWASDYTLKTQGLFIKTVDFSASEYTVAHGRTDRVTVDIVGGANTNGNGTVYAKIKNGGAVSLAEDSVEVVEMWDGEATNAYQVAKVTIPSGEDVYSFSFKVKGVVEGGTNNVYLSSTKEFAFDDGHVIQTNFIVAAVRCVAPPPPYISVTLDGVASKSITSSTNFVDYSSKLTVTLSEACTSDVVVAVAPAMLSGSGTEPLGTYIGMSSYSENGFAETNRTVTFTVEDMENGILSKNLYVYVLGAGDDTDGIGKGIKFTPAATNAAAASYFKNENESAILYIKKCTPLILYPTENNDKTKPTYSGLAGGVNSAFTFEISDDYMNMQSNYEVEWYKTGSGDPQKFTVKPNSDGEATVSVRYNAGEYTTRFRVKNSSGVYSEMRTVTVQVNPAKQVSAIVTSPADTDEFAETLGEISVKFSLTEAYEDSTLYAFLVPLDSASSNLVSCKAFDTGIAIKSGDTESTGFAKIKLLDGTDLTLPLAYSIVLQTNKKLNAGETISTYESKDLELYVNNVAPSVLAVNMSGSAPVTVNGGTFGGKASMGLNKIFTLDAADVELDLTNDVTSVWTFSDPNGNAINRTVKAPLAKIALTNVFEVAGTYSCMVKLQDKDMSSSEYGEVFNFKVVVLDAPSVAVTFPNSSTFDETDADKGLSYFNVELSTPATKLVEVELECTQIGKDGALNIATNRVVFRAGQTIQKVLIDELDGTADSVSFKGGFSVTAKVITETENEDGVPYNKVYLPATEKMYVANTAPEIVLPIDTGATNDAAINVYIPIKWKIADVDSDLTNNLTVVWTTSEGRTQEFKGNDVFEGVFTNVFMSGGAKTVTMTVTDKDDGISSVTLYYKVSPSKQAKVYPMGPYYGGLTPLSRMYSTAAGVGEGRVWGNGGSCQVQDFVHKYTYGFSDTSAEIFAWGYRNGQIDDGSLVAGRDIAISTVGNSFNLGAEPSGCYTYSDTAGRDSFFYAWIIASKDEEATAYAGTPLIAPLNPKSKTGSAQYSLSLPLEQAGDDNRPVFPERYLEAFFAKELYPADNMGDMNADGVPDYFATLYWSTSAGESKTVPEAMTGQAIAGASGGEEGGEGETATASDLAKIDAYNGDEDFLPAAWEQNNPLKPTVANWGPGVPFTTVKEIRGFGRGLNEPGVSDYELTAAEVHALSADMVAVSGESPADYSAATNWATRTGWTPEAVHPLSGARLNPLNSDTDGDGFDDGWEYHFWYYSRIGAVTNGVWGRLEGRRYSPLDPGAGIRISPEEIEEAFNPHVARAAETEFGKDFDNDGLSDLEEFVLGTNPCDWDSDGDGASDLWEVMTGLNPCSAIDGYENPDCDFMARCEYQEDTFTLYAFADGKVFALPTATDPEIVLSEPAATSSYFKVEIAAGSASAEYWCAEQPKKYAVDAVEYLARDAEAFATLDVGGAKLLGEKVVLRSGTPVVSVADEPEPVVSAILPETGFAWTNPGTLDRGTTAKALEVFNYGGDGVTYVPCTSNATSYAEIPAGVAVVKVQPGMKVTLLHNQVMVQYGFDPRVAWNIDEYGFLDKRWRQPDSENAGSMGFAGVPTNTVDYASRDEYLVMQYRIKTGLSSAHSSVIGVQASVGGFMEYTTFPNLPLDFVKGLEYSHTPFSSTNTAYAAYWDSLTKYHKVHGADTDHDGVPDGWELYVNANPNVLSDSTVHKDDDRLSLVQEYAGVDSCNAYTNRFDLAGNLVYPEVETVTKYHPGKDGGWWNKFFPTNPDSNDTDGDGLKDHEERDSRRADFPVGRNSYSATLTFIYGDNAEKYAADGTTVCFRGGGLNPCTVDTDGDLLPDAWEWEFAGIVFNGATPSAALDSTDILKLVQADAHQTGIDTNSAASIRGGMDGTFANDASWDFDQDGLLNCQEYLVQSLRHLRFDDALTPLMGVDPGTRQFIRFLPFSAWDGNAFHEVCKKNGFTGLGAWQFSKLGYFALPPHSWDPTAQNLTGLASCSNYGHSEGAGYRIMLRPSVELPLVGERKATGYATTDPRRWDTDNDGMDDYYEIFHGLNPLLGSAADPLAVNEQGLKNVARYDVIGAIYGGVVTAWCNHWTGYALDEQPAFDAIRFPWMIGTMECDADGDGLRNDEESVKVNVAKPSNTHTDPTPLWMTDSTSAKFASFTSQYYRPDPYVSETPMYSEITSAPDLFFYPWTDLRHNTVVYAPGSGGINRDYMFSFEENEGYDTDHDFKRDASELVKGVDPTSDPLNFMDPNRRQALYLPGAESAAVSYDSESRRSIGTEPDLLKQFTVECWVCPDGEQTDKVIVERVCVYGASTLSNSQTCIRANFRIGIDGNGTLYGEYEGSTADSGSIRVKQDGIGLEPGVWSHVAFTYDGYSVALYKNGNLAPVASRNGVGLIPANGIDGILQETGSAVMPYTGYRALPCANIIGARALTPGAVSVNPDTTWSDFSSFYKGWIDEVRVWDGARKPEDIHSDYLKRYSFDDVSGFRETVFKAWRNGATRADPDPKTALPPELLLHYNFVSLPGGRDEEGSDVISTPVGFMASVIDNVRKPNGKNLDDSLEVGWWSGLSAINSKVYFNRAIVPWIPNTVAHLPLMDGSSIDSQYWNSYASGLVGAYYSNVDGYAYPNTANPYPSYVHRFEKVHHLNRLGRTGTLQVPDSSGYLMYYRYAFQLRSDFVGSSDLVPLGGAFAKRGTSFWDGQGAMDAWTVTAKDYDDSVTADGIPQWAADLGYATVDSYLSALAEGLLPDGTKDPAFADRADADHDGLVDWWQRMHDLKSDAKHDTDKDGLADFAEYLVSESPLLADSPKVSPVLAKTNGKEFDYFLKAGKVYLGEIFADHDFMEDEWENRFANSVVSAAKYDSAADPDADGWSNYAECRAGSLPDRTASITAEGQQVPDYPEPMISVKAFCKNAAQISAPVIVKAYSGGNLGVADATWDIPGSDEAVTYERVIGINPGVKTKYMLGPSVVVPGSVHVFMRDPAELSVTDGKGVWTSSSEWRELLRETPVPGDNFRAEVRPGASGEVVGGIEYRTGEFNVDFSAVPAYRFQLEDGTYMFYSPNTNTYIRSNIAQSYVKIQWQSKRLADDSKWEFALGRASAGHVREGLNTFVVFADLDGNGDYTKGEPMGIVRDVDVGWNSAGFAVELTVDSPVCERPSVAGVSVNGSTTAYVYRYSVDDMLVPPSTLDYGPVVKREIGSRTYIHEYDLLNAGDYDLDWSGFTDSVLGNVTVEMAGLPVNKVVYRAYFKEVDIVDETVNSNGTPYVEFVREFGETRAKAIPVAPLNSSAVFYGNRPTFRWTIDGERADTFTAFAIRVKSGDEEIWNSGVNMLPPRNTSGEYEWTAPLYVGDRVANGRTFGGRDNYTWSVSVYNSKFQTSEWSDDVSKGNNYTNTWFRMNVYAADEVNNAGTYSFQGCVKYFGPGFVSTNASGGIVRAEAFATPDFSGVPVARAAITNIASLTNDAHEANVTFTGLEAGTYYLRAYVDSDGDGKRSPWESWGYACGRGDIVTGAIFAPTAINVGLGLSPLEIAYIEDTDIDQDCLPDIYEYDTADVKAEGFLALKGPSSNGADGYIGVNPELAGDIERNSGNAMAYLFSAGAGSVPSGMAALMLGVPDVEPAIDEGSFGITSFSLEGETVKLTVGAKADDPLAGTVFVSGEKISAEVVVLHAATLADDFRPVKTVSVAFDIEDGAVTHTESFSLAELLGRSFDTSKGFFKVELKQ